MGEESRKDPATVLQNWVLRCEVGSQKLIDDGKDNYLMLNPQARVVEPHRRQKSAGAVAVLKNSPEKRVFLGETVPLGEEDFVRWQASIPGLYVAGQEDGRFHRMPSKRVALESLLRDIQTPGFLVQVDLGYMSPSIQTRVVELEEALTRSLSYLPTIKRHREISRAWFNQFRLIDPRLFGVNTKFLNDLVQHAGADDLISAILLYVWGAVRDLNASNWKWNEQGYWNGNVLIFRKPPDSIYLWFPTSDPDKEASHILVLKRQVQQILRQLHEQIKKNTVEGIDLSFVVSVLAVKDTAQKTFIPRHDLKRARALLEVMEGAYRVFKEKVISGNAHLLDTLWKEMGGVPAGTPPEILRSICETLAATFKASLAEIDPEHSEVHFESLSEDRFLTDGQFFLVYNGGIEVLSDAIKIDLAVNSEVEILRRFMAEKGAKWKREVELARESGKPNLDELVYILSSLLEKEGELRRFAEMAKIFRGSVHDTDDLFNKIQAERQKAGEKIFHLTGLYFDPKKGVRVPEKGEKVLIRYAYQEFGQTHAFYFTCDGQTRVAEVLKDPKRRRLWVQLRQKERELLQFTRHQPLFVRMVESYEELLSTMPLAHQLIRKLLEDSANRPLYLELARVLSKETPVEFPRESGKEKEYRVVFRKNGKKDPVILNSVTPQQFQRLRERFKSFPFKKVEAVLRPKLKPLSAVEIAI